MALIKEFESSLLREKFVIHDVNKASLEKSVAPVMAVSNRMAVQIKNHRGIPIETFIVRAQNMHCCVRMAARILQAYETTGIISGRATPFNWENAWKPIVNEFEQRFNDEIWVAVYQKGKPIYKDGDPHPFLDAIEKIDDGHKGKYEETIPLAEKAFKSTGKDVRIEYDGNVALVVDMDEEMAKCSVILRGADKTTTFNYTAQAKSDFAISIPHCLGSAASFLEGVQLAFRVGMDEHKLHLGIIERKTKDEEFVTEGRKRLQKLGTHIANLEDTYEVRYRPERPLFQKIMTDARKLAQKVIKPPTHKPKSSDSDSEEVWVD